MKIVKVRGAYKLYEDFVTP